MLPGARAMMYLVLTAHDCRFGPQAHPIGSSPVKVAWGNYPVSKRRCPRRANDSSVFTASRTQRICVPTYLSPRRYASATRCRLQALYETYMCSCGNYTGSLWNDNVGFGAGWKCW